jgi:hypothetical protein
VGPDFALALLELSQGGACLLAREGLSPGQEVELEFTGVCQNRPLRVAGCVARSEPAKDGTFKVGVRFDHNLSYAQLLNLT